MNDDIGPTIDALKAYWETKLPIFSPYDRVKDAAIRAQTDINSYESVAALIVGNQDKSEEPRFKDVVFKEPSSDPLPDTAENKQNFINAIYGGTEQPN
jgi:hypothetical protein